MYTSNQTYARLGNSIGQLISGGIGAYYKSKKEEESRNALNSLIDFDAQAMSSIPQLAPETRLGKPVGNYTPKSVVDEKIQTNLLKQLTPKDYKAYTTYKTNEAKKRELEFKKKKYARDYALKAAKEIREQEKWNVEKEKEKRQYGLNYKPEDINKTYEAALNAFTRGDAETYARAMTALPLEYQKRLVSATDQIKKMTDVKVIGNANTPMVYALDKRTGKPVWARKNPNYVPKSKQPTDFSKTASKYLTDSAKTFAQEKYLREQINVLNGEKQKYADLLTQAEDEGAKTSIKKKLIEIDAKIGLAQAKLNETQATNNIKKQTIISQALAVQHPEWQQIFKGVVAASQKPNLSEEDKEKIARAIYNATKLYGAEFSTSASALFTALFGEPYAYYQKKFATEEGAEILKNAE